MLRKTLTGQVMPYPYATGTPISSEYMAAGKAALGDKFDPNYSSIDWEPSLPPPPIDAGAPV